MSDIAQMMRAANPVPDPVAALPEVELETLLVLTETRRTNMSIDQLETSAMQKRPPNRQPPWLVAAAAFVLVMLIGAAVWVVGLADQTEVVDTPPTTAAPSTTTAPSTTAEATTTTTTTIPPTALEFVAALNSGAYASFFAEAHPDIVFSEIRGEVGNPDEISRDELERRIQWAVDLNTTLEIEFCRPNDNGTITCRVTRHDDLLRASSLPPIIGQHTLSFQDGQVIAWFDGTDIRGYQGARHAFDTWLSENRSEAPSFAGGFLWDWEEDGSLARSYLVEYAESRGVTLPG